MSEPNRLLPCRLLSLALLVALTLLCTQVEAQRRRRRGAAPAPQPVAGKARARHAAPPPEIQSHEDDPLAFVFRWQQRLASSMPGPLAWGVLATPLWLPLLLWALVGLLRRRRGGQDDGPAHAKPRANAKDTPPLPRLPEQATPEVPALALSPEQQALDRSEGSPSLYETFLALGAGPEGIRAWRAVARDELTPQLWRALVAGEHDDLRKRICVRWLKRLARERLLAWMIAHPVIGGENLQVQLPDDLEVASLTELALIGPDSLGVKPDAQQDELLRAVRRSLTLAFRGADNPFALQLVAEHAEMPALLLGKDEGELPQTHSLAVTLCGVETLDRASTAGLIDAGRGSALLSCLERHQEKSNLAVPGEGVAAYAVLKLPDAEPEAMATLLASIAGAAYSPATVALEVSRRLSSLDGDALETLGRGAAPLLAAAQRPEAKQLYSRMRELLGADELSAELERVRHLEQALEREVTRSPLWPGIRPASSPEVALMGLHRRRLEHALLQVQAAFARLTQVLAKVAYAGKTSRDQRIAAQRLGYVLGGLGAGIFDLAPSSEQSDGSDGASNAELAQLYEAAQAASAVVYGHVR